MVRNIVITAAMLLATSAAHAESFDETRAIAGNGRVLIENVRGTIRVEGSDRADVRISGTLGKGAKGLTVEGDERRLSISIDYPDSGGSWFGGFWGGGDYGDSELVVELPATVSLDVESVSASVDVRGITGERVDIDTVSGDVDYAGSAADIKLDSVSGEARLTGSAREANLQSVSGNIRSELALDRRLIAETVSGDLDVQSAGSLDQVRVESVSGDVSLSFGLQPGGRLSAEVLSGDFELLLPSASSAQLNIETFSGSIRSAQGKVKKAEYGPGATLQTQLGDGDGDIRIESFSGDVVVRLQ